MQDVADLLSLSPPWSCSGGNPCMKAEPTMQFLGMSWECPLTLMAPRPPHGLCQLWGAVWWQQGTLEELLRLFCQESLGLSWSFGEHWWNVCGQEKCRSLLCSCHPVVFSGLCGFFCCICEVILTLLGPVVPGSLVAGCDMQGEVRSSQSIHLQSGMQDIG